MEGLADLRRPVVDLARVFSLGLVKGLAALLLGGELLRLVAGAPLEPFVCAFAQLLEAYSSSKALGSSFIEFKVFIEYFFIEFKGSTLKAASSRALLV